MSLKKAKKYLDKVNLLFAGISEDNHVSRIERDLMLNYLQQLYDAFYEETGEKPKSKTSKPTYTKPVYKEPTYTKPEPPKPPKPVYTPPTPPPVEKPVYKEPTYRKPEPPKPPKPVYTPTPPPTEKPVQKEPTYKRPEPPAWKEPEVREKPKVKITKPEPPKPSTSADDKIYRILFEEEQVRELSQKLSQKAVKDLKSAMGINERFLIINELFEGNSSKFQEAISALNGLNSFSEAKRYITGELAGRFEWTDEKRLKRAQEFIRKVKRRYL